MTPEAFASRTSPWAHSRTWVTLPGDASNAGTSIVWIDTDGQHVIFNTTNSRAKGKHLRRDPRVSVSVFDKEDPYRYFEVEGTAELELAGANEHITTLSQKYRGVDFHTPVDRVIVKVKPERIFDYQVS